LLNVYTKFNENPTNGFGANIRLQTHGRTGGRCLRIRRYSFIGKERQ